MDMRPDADEMGHPARPILGHTARSRCDTGETSMRQLMDTQRQPIIFSANQERLRGGWSRCVSGVSSFDWVARVHHHSPPFERRSVFCFVWFLSQFELLLLGLEREQIRQLHLGICGGVCIRLLVAAAAAADWSLF